MRKLFYRLKHGRLITDILTVTKNIVNGKAIDVITAAIPGTLDDKIVAIIKKLLSDYTARLEVNKNDAETLKGLALRLAAKVLQEKDGNKESLGYYIQIIEGSFK